MPRSAEIQMQELVDVITTSLQDGDGVESLIAKAEAPPDELKEYVNIIHALQTSLVPQEPSAEFSDGLREGLLGRDVRLPSRFRQMPARVPVAAVLAIFFGCVVFVLRRLFGSEPPGEIQEEAVVTPL